MFSRLKILVLLCLCFTILLQSNKSYASSEASCAIWICLPGGFPQGCSAAYSEFKKRIKKGRSPLPKLSSCTTGPNGQSIEGSYKFGYEEFVTCKAGYVYRKKLTYSHNQSKGRCFQQSCAPKNKYLRSSCPGYSPEVRELPHYIKIWVDGKYVGQYFYQ